MDCCPILHKPEKVMVWGCIGEFGVGPLIFVEGTLNGQSYSKVLQHAIPLIRRKARRNFVLQQDNAPCHKAKLVLEVLHHAGVRVTSWPAVSPDINPIENVWELVKQGVSALNPHTRDELISCIKKVWKALPKAAILRCIDSMPDRLQAVIDSSGFPIDY
jgi:transposase